MREINPVKARRARITAAMVSRSITIDGKHDWRELEEPASDWPAFPPMPEPELPKKLGRPRKVAPAAIELPPAPMEPEAPKRRGRPVGSKNKPKNRGTLELDRAGSVASSDHAADVELEGRAETPELPRPATTGLSHLAANRTVPPAEGLTAPELAEIEAICSRLVLMAAKWKFFVKQKNAIQNRTRAYFRVFRFGWNAQMPAEQTVKIEAKINALMEKARKGESDDAEAIMMVTVTDEAMKPFAEPAERIAKEMGRLAEQLPGAAFVRATKGLGFVSIAKIIGQTGPLHKYSSKSKVWKRLGLAVIEEAPGMLVRQQKRTNAELAALHGYSPSRRSICWTAYDAMFRNQDPEYRAIYDRKKLDYLTRKENGVLDARGRPWTSARADNAARRYVEKRVVARLWAAWRADCGIGRENIRPRKAKA